MTVTTEARNATMEDMLAILQNQQARKIDLVAPGDKLRFVDGKLELKGLEPLVEEDGVTEVNGLYRPTDVFDEGVADRLDIPLKYVRRLRSDRLDLYDANANGWLQGRKEKRRMLTMGEEGYLGPNTPAYQTLVDPTPGDARKFLVRLFRGDNDETGVARALLSNRYSRLDNLDGLMAMLGGIQEAGIDPSTLTITGDLSERRMYLKVEAPQITALAPELLKGYRNPFAHDGIERVVRGQDVDHWREVANREGMGYTEEEGGEPVVFAGFIFKNSEVGEGKWSIERRITIKICKNGLTFSDDAFGRVHLGAALEQGVIDWSQDTLEKSLHLVTAQTRDAVKMFLDKDSLAAKVSELEEKSGKPLSKPSDTIKALGKKLAFSDDAVEGILNHFMLGGQLTAGGVAQAITSYSQTVEDADTAYDLEGKALRALEMAYAAV